MKRLINEEIKYFNTVINQKFHCKCREFNKILISGKATNKDLLEIEVFLKIQCPEFYMLVQLYQDQRIQNDNLKKAIDDPTTQE